jgi:hypothetical protein
VVDDLVNGANNNPHISQADVRSISICSALSKINFIYHCLVSCKKGGRGRILTCIAKYPAPFGACEIRIIPFGLASIEPLPFTGHSPIINLLYTLRPASAFVRKNLPVIPDRRRAMEIHAITPWF